MDTKSPSKRKVVTSFEDLQYGHQVGNLLYGHTVSLFIAVLLLRKAKPYSTTFGTLFVSSSARKCRVSIVDY